MKEKELRYEYNFEENKDNKKRYRHAEIKKPSLLRGLLYKYLILTLMI